ncbi:MAG: LLM class flavin-dependent oxidoreductase [Hyphomicrobiales bacterium]|nr:MAG: LLM class flavin-dependent oxidoreductase [Hyphomicrobiales bacterium]
MSTARNRKMNLAIFMIPQGNHIAGWRHPDSSWEVDRNFEFLVEMTQRAEQSKFDLVFLADAVVGPDPTVDSTAFSPLAAQYDPLTLLPALAARTNRIGLVATATTTYNEPFHIARKFGTLDLISGGRSGWNAVTSASPTEAHNFQRGDIAEREDRYARAEEFVDVVRGLWDTFEDGALVSDRKTGQFLDVSKVHRLNHDGEIFSVKGPLTCERSPQGRPVLVQAGQSEAGMRLAARTADVVFTAQASLEQGKVFYSDLKGRLSEFSRSPSDVVILPGLMPIIGQTRTEAEDLLESLQELIHPDIVTAILQRTVGGADLSGVDMNAPPPAWLADLPNSRATVLLKTAQEKGMTMRQLALQASISRGHHVVVGTVNDVCDVMQAWFESNAADGFNILPPYFMNGFSSFLDGVVPELQRRGLFRTEYEGATLRDHLGLSKPAGGALLNSGVSPARRAAG